MGDDARAPDVLDRPGPPSGPPSAAPSGSPMRGVAVLDALAALVERAGLQAGDRLPPEVQLARNLGVGRSTMREALKHWEGLGLIRRRRGDGTYLAARVHAQAGPVPPMVRLEGEGLLRLLEVRRALENDVVRRAAGAASPAQRAEIARLCDALLSVVGHGGSWREANWAFHGAIYDASGNPMFGQILRRLDEMFERSRESPFGRDAFGLRSFPIHRALSDAVVAGDADRAAAAVNALLDTVEREVRRIIQGGPR